MECTDHEQPGDEHDVLDGVPPPVAAPAQLGVGPVGAGELPGGQHCQGARQRDAQPGPHVEVEPQCARRGVGAAACGDDEGERHPARDEPEVEQRRVVQHRRVLEDRLEAAARDRRDGEPVERRREDRDDRRQRGNRREPHARRPSRRPPPRTRRDDGGDHRREQQQRAGRATPQPGQPVPRPDVAVRMIDHVHVRQVEAPQQHPERGGGHPERNSGDGRCDPLPGGPHDADQCSCARDPDRPAPEHPCVDH